MEFDIGKIKRYDLTHFIRIHIMEENKSTTYDIPYENIDYIEQIWEINSKS